MNKRNNKLKKSIERLKMCQEDTTRCRMLVVQGPLQHQSYYDFHYILGDLTPQSVYFCQKTGHEASFSKMMTLDKHGNPHRKNGG